MRKKEKGYIELGGFFVALIVFGVIIGLLISFGVPWFWEIIKPFIHTISA